MPDELAFGRPFVGDLELSCPHPRTESGMCRRGAGAGRRSPAGRPGTGGSGYGDVEDRRRIRSRPAPTLKAGVNVMLEATRDELPAIQRLWPRFEGLTGLRGVPGCTPWSTPGRDQRGVHSREGDDPARFGLDTGELPGGWYLRVRIRRPVWAV